MNTWAVRSATLGMCLGLAGCVTINIYFPAAAAEKVADRIIEEVWQLKPAKPAALDSEGTRAAPPGDRP